MAIAQEVKGDLPVFKANMLQVYLTCVGIVSTTSDRYHGSGTEQGQRCLCFVDAMLSAADNCKRGKKTWKASGCKELVRICQEALDEHLV